MRWARTNEDVLVFSPSPTLEGDRSMDGFCECLGFGLGKVNRAFFAGEGDVMSI